MYRYHLYLHLHRPNRMLIHVLITTGLHQTLDALSPHETNQSIQVNLLLFKHGDFVLQSHSTEEFLQSCLLFFLFSVISNGELKSVCSNLYHIAVHVQQLLLLSKYTVTENLFYSIFTACKFLYHASYICEYQEKEQMDISNVF